VSKHAICYTCDENIPEEAAADNECPECGGRVSDSRGKVMIVEAERRQTDGNAT
jgi:predicted RNA-binding Zn-ribbon protein involved in translation (DUF1610 family)